MLSHLRDNTMRRQRSTARNRSKILLLLPLLIPLFFYVSFGIGVEYSERNLPWWHWDSPRDDTGHTTNSVEIKNDIIWSPLPANKRDSDKIILYNHRPFGLGSDWVTNKAICGGNCLVTYDAASYRQKADAILYHCVEMDQNVNIRRSHPEQLFVFLCQESPSTTRYLRPGSLKRYNNIFNLTMTYRRDSDFLMPYGNLFDTQWIVKKTEMMKDLNIFVQKKTGLSLWIVSNCGLTKGSYHRTYMMKQLVLAGLDVDLQGTCFTAKEDIDRDQMTDYISRYKFYFAFENALHCKDYITEKVWLNSLQAGAVPIIWGPRKSDVEAVLPRHSYIMVEDFSNPSELVKYLKFLDKNDAAYKKYFAWWHDPLAKSMLNRECGLCYAMNSGVYRKPSNRKILPSLDDWWFYKESLTCTFPSTEAEVANFEGAIWYLTNIRITYASVLWYTFVIELVLVVFTAVASRR